MPPILARMKRWSYAWKTWMGCTKPGGSTLHSGRNSGMCSKRHCIRRPEAWEGDDRKDDGGDPQGSPLRIYSRVWKVREATDKTKPSDRHQICISIKVNTTYAFPHPTK